MAIFEEKDYGKKISEKLSNYILKHTDGFDIMEVCLKMKYSSETIKAVLRRHRNLTPNNSKPVIELFKIAMKGYADTKRLGNSKEIKELSKKIA